MRTDGLTLLLCLTRQQQAALAASGVLAALATDADWLGGGRSPLGSAACNVFTLGACLSILRLELAGVVQFLSLPPLGPSRSKPLPGQPRLADWSDQPTQAPTTPELLLASCASSAEEITSTQLP